MSIDAMKQALEALEEYTNVVTSANDPNGWVTVVDGGGPARKAITALRQAIEQAEQYNATSDNQLMENAQGELERIKLVQTGVGIGKPEQEPVAELTDDEIYDAAYATFCRGPNTRELFRMMWMCNPPCSIGWDRNELKAFARHIASLYTSPPQKKQEPVSLKPCWYESKEMKMCPKCGQVHAEAIIDTTPLPRQPLTDEEKHMLAAKYDVGVDVVTAIEAAHGIKGEA